MTNPVSLLGAAESATIRQPGLALRSKFGELPVPHRRVDGDGQMRFGVLGPLQVQDTDDEEVALPGAGPRAVLAALLVHANQAVPVDRIVEAVWRGQPPRSWVSNVQTYISRLRHALPGLDIRYAD